MSKLARKKHNVSVLLYHIVCPIKYRKKVFTLEIEEEFKNICVDISKRYEITFIEIGIEGDHVHFLVQSVPMYSPKKIVQIIKSITARILFSRRPEVMKKLWGGEFWSKGYFIATVGRHGDENSIKKYVQEQGKPKEYKRIYKDQLELF